MNFTFLVIFLLLTLAITYKTLKISNKQLTLIVLVLFIILVSYNVKEKFQVQTSSSTENQTSSSSNIDSLDSLVLNVYSGNVTEEQKSIYLEQAPNLVTINNELLIYEFKDTEYLSELVKKLQGLQMIGGLTFGKSNFTSLNGFNNLTRVSNFINTDLTADGSVVTRNYEWYTNSRKMYRNRGRLYIKDNVPLIDINGFNSLINTNIIIIYRNNQLKTIEGFSSIRKINELYISGNYVLESIKAFENLEIVDGPFSIWANTLKELQPFTKLKTVTIGVTLVGGLFNDPNFDIDYYFPKLISVGNMNNIIMSETLKAKFRARPGFTESETPSLRALTLDNIREDSDEAPKDASNSLVLDNMKVNVVTEELKSTYLEQASDLVTISNDLGIYDIKDTEYLSELVKKLQGLQVVGAKFHFFGTNLTRLAGFNNLTRVSNFINTDLTADGSVVTRNYEWYTNSRKMYRNRGRLYIKDNVPLIDINGFNSLINTNIIIIYRNNQLKTIEGFSSIRKINELYISGNYVLESIKAFENLEIVDGPFSIWANTLKELQPFTKLKTVTIGVTLVGGLFNDPNFDIDYYFPKLISVGNMNNIIMSETLKAKFRARPGFTESETPSLRALTLDNNNQTSSSTSTELVEEDPRFFLMDSPESINNYLNLLNMNKKKPKLVNGNIYAEALDSHKKV